MELKLREINQRSVNIISPSSFQKLEGVFLLIYVMLFANESQMK